MCHHFVGTLHFSSSAEERMHRLSLLVAYYITQYLPESSISAHFVPVVAPCRVLYYTIPSRIVHLGAFCTGCRFLSRIILHNTFPNRPCRRIVHRLSLLVAYYITQYLPESSMSAHCAPVVAPCRVLYYTIPSRIVNVGAFYTGCRSLSRIILHNTFPNRPSRRILYQLSLLVAYYITQYLPESSMSAHFQARIQEFSSGGGGPTSFRKILTSKKKKQNKTKQTRKRGDGRALQYLLFFGIHVVEI